MGIVQAIPLWFDGMAVVSHDEQGVPEFMVMWNRNNKKIFMTLDGNRTIEQVYPASRVVDLLEASEDALSYFVECWKETGQHPSSHYRSHVDGLTEAIEKVKIND